MNPAAVLNKAIQRARYNTGRIFKEAGLTLDRYGSRMSSDVAYQLDLSRHRQQLPLYDDVPEVNKAWVAPNATLVGNVFVSNFATVWYGVTIRGELNPVRIGSFSSIGDGSTLLTNHSMPHNQTASVNIGKNVKIEADCVIHSCIIDDDCVIGANSVVQQGARLERGCQIMPNSVVPAGALIPSGQVWGGQPCTYVRDLSEEEIIQAYTSSYSHGAASYDANIAYPAEFKDEPLSSG